MKLEYNGHEDIPATLDAVWAFVSDPQSVASCLPDVQQTTIKDATHFEVSVRVGLGPVRGNFKFKVELQPDRPNDRMTVKISGGGLGSAVDLTAGADVKESDHHSTLVDWHGAATMRGPVATVGGRVLDAQAQKLITQTFANVKIRMAEAATPA